MSNYAALPGFRDFYPDDFAIRDHIIGTWRNVARRYGFREYDGPPLEALELYTDKSGPEIVKQLYAFTDKGGREVALRPEMTPTLARMVGARAGGLRKPVKWFSIPQVFRYERQQRGRLREHFQLNMDIVGEANAAADAELLAAAIDLLRAFGLEEGDFVARISDRRMLGALLNDAGVPPEKLTQVFNIVDKLEREGADSVGRRLADEADLNVAAVSGVLRIFEFRDYPALKEEYGARLGGDFEEIDDYFRHLGALGCTDFVRFDLSIVRGLAYYSGIVFELFDARGELRAIAGGGRYDRLLDTVGGVDLPALGFAMGDVVLRELLDDQDLLPKAAHSVDYYLVAVTPDQRPEVLGLARRLRDAGNAVDYALRPRGVGKQFKDAAALSARRTVVIGPDEVADGVAIVRDMASGDERRVPLAEVGV